MRKYKVIKKFGIRRIRRNESSEDMESLDKNDNSSLISKGYKEC